LILAIAAVSLAKGSWFCLHYSTHEEKKAMNFMGLAGENHGRFLELPFDVGCDTLRLRPNQKSNPSAEQNR